MREKVIAELNKIESEEAVQIVYACESGSRAWGFPSRDSDFDVRFIYVHTPEWYLSVFEGRDVIERPINELLDISGWDLRKALQLFKKSNPPLMEWLQSPIIYMEKYTTAQAIRDVSPLVFSPHSCISHYLSMAKGNFRQYLQGDFVKAKKYFYVLRPVLACLWIKSKNTMPPMTFEVLVEEIIKEKRLKEVVLDLLRRKKAGDELNLEPKIDMINNYLEWSMEEINLFLNTNKCFGKRNHPDYNRIFREALAEIWGLEL